MTYDVQAPLITRTVSGPYIVLKNGLSTAMHLVGFVGPLTSRNLETKIMSILPPRHEPVAAAKGIDLHASGNMERGTQNAWSAS